MPTTTATIEARILRRVIRDAIAAGYELSVYDGETLTVRNSTNARAVFAALRTTDMDWLQFRKGGEAFGSVLFVYGNDGWDVIADNNTRLEPVLAGATALAERLETLHG